MRLVALLALATACRTPPDPQARARVDALLAVRFAEGPLDLKRFSDRARRAGSVTVTPVRFLLRPGRPVAAALFEPANPTAAGVVVAHGHFGQGKSGPEAQEIAHQLAQRGARVLVVDTPGVEEWDTPGQHIHFDEGAHNRAYLAAGGSSALSLQVQSLQRGLDVLQGLGATRFGATGASGGAVQSAWLQLVDDRVEIAVMASFVPMPREARAGGCPCDQSPGWPGPDPALFTLFPRPNLWLADEAASTPEGEPAHGRVVQTSSPHSYDAAMQAEALAAFSRALPLRAPAAEAAPLFDLATPGPEADPHAEPLFALPLPGAPVWEPAPAEGSGRRPVELSCRGTGPTLLVAGGGAAHVQAVAQAGATACAVEVLPDEIGLAEGIATGTPYAARLGAALVDAGRMRAAVGIVAVRGWAAPAAASGLRFGVVDPLRALADVDPATDPAWVHTPGAWWGGSSRILADAEAIGSAQEVASALLRAPATPP